MHRTKQASLWWRLQYWYHRMHMSCIFCFNKWWSKYIQIVITVFHFEIIASFWTLMKCIRRLLTYTANKWEPQTHALTVLTWWTETLTCQNIPVSIHVCLCDLRGSPAVSREALAQHSQDSCISGRSQKKPHLREVWHEHCVSLLSPSDVSLRCST